MVEIQGHYIQASMVQALVPRFELVSGRVVPTTKVVLPAVTITLRGTPYDVALKLKLVTDWEKKA